MAALLALGPIAAAALLPAALQLEPFGRRALSNYLNEKRGIPDCSIDWCDATRGAALQQQFWQQLVACAENGDRSVLAVPKLTSSELAALIELPQEATDGTSICALEDAPVPAILLEPGSTAPAKAWMTEASEQVVVARSRAWVDRTLSPGPLRFCPYTGSASESATGLESFGVAAAPIAYGVCPTGEVAALVRDFWQMVSQMLSGGEAVTSSILLMAPAWDSRFEEWSSTVFPALEAGLIASGLSRQIGIVCFHPCYMTPDERWLARHRFGHMHSTPRLRRWLDEVDPQLSQRVSDEEIHWAASYQRRAPHATVNVLWSRQLETAEQLRSSASLYTRNLRRCLAVGLEQLQMDAEKERTGNASLEG